MGDFEVIDFYRIKDNPANFKKVFFGIENDLKTLKDRIDELKKGCGNIFKHGKDGEQVGCEKKDLCPNCQVRLDELKRQRQEAIKWYKNKGLSFIDDNDWLGFFNITEDDLK